MDAIVYVIDILIRDGLTFLYGQPLSIVISKARLFALLVLKGRSYSHVLSLDLFVPILYSKLCSMIVSL